MFTPLYLQDAYASGELHRKKTGPSQPLLKRPIPLPAGIHNLRFKKPRLYFDHGLDLPPEALVGEPPANKTGTASSLFLEMLLQIMERLGTISSSRIRYCKLSEGDVRRMSLESFRDVNLSTYLVSYQYTRGTSAWTHVRATLFPGLEDAPIGIGNRTVQGWRNVPAYKDYLELREVGGEEFEKSSQILRFNVRYTKMVSSSGPR